MIINIKLSNDRTSRFAARAETGTRDQQWKQQRRRETAFRSRHRSGGRSGDTLRRIPPPWEAVRRGIELEDAANMRLPEAARRQVRIALVTRQLITELIPMFKNKYRIC